MNIFTGNFMSRAVKQLSEWETGKQSENVIRTHKDNIELYDLSNDKEKQRILLLSILKL